MFGRFFTASIVLLSVVDHYVWSAAHPCVDEMAVIADIFEADLCVIVDVDVCDKGQWEYRDAVARGDARAGRGLRAGFW